MNAETIIEMQDQLFENQCKVAELRDGGDIEAAKKQLEENIRTQQEIERRMAEEKTERRAAAQQEFMKMGWL